ncbi:MAG: syntaxin binding protein 1 [Marteilia pararefringens]
MNQNNAKIKNIEVNGRLIKELARSLNSRNQYQHAMNKTISGEYEQDVQEIVRICRSDTGSPLSPDEKLRLIALYCLNKRGSLPPGELKSICCQCGIPDEKVKLLTNLDTIGLPISKPLASAMATAINFDQEGAYIPESARLARVVASGSKDPELGSMNDQSARKSYIAHPKGKFLNINAKHQRAKKPQLYIIFVGGITMYDQVCLSRQNIKDYDIVCISDRQIHSKNFLEDFGKETDA